jgi:Holliday junction resolvase RusA-like endonuclease
MPRPKSHYNRHGLKLDAPTFHTGKPDRDNVEKGILDALTALGMWEDDGQVCQGSVDKIYGERPGAVIVIQHAVMIESGHAIEQGRLL